MTRISNPWYLWPIMISFALVLVASFGLLMHYSVGETDNGFLLALSAVGGAFSLALGMVAGSWVARWIESRRHEAG